MENFENWVDKFRIFSKIFPGADRGVNRKPYACSFQKYVRLLLEKSVRSFFGGREIENCGLGLWWEVLVCGLVGSTVTRRRKNLRKSKIFGFSKMLWNGPKRSENVF